MKVSVPELGDFADVEIIELLVKVGDRLEPEDPIVTLETEKATMDVPSPASGVVRDIKIAVGDRVSTGDELIQLDEAGDESQAAGSEEKASTETAESKAPAGSGESKASAESDESKATAGTAESKASAKTKAPAAEAKAPAAEPSAEAPPAAQAPSRSVPAEHRPGQSTAEPGSGVDVRRQAVDASAGAPAIDEASFRGAHASPSVRKLARELGVDLGRVQGNGRKGRITADDVKGYVKEILRGGGAGAALPAVPEVDFAKFGAIEHKALSRIQRISGSRVHASWVNVPHVTQHDEADVTALEEARAELKAQAEERGIRLTPLAFVVRACALMLGEFPDFKSSLSADGKNLIVKHYTHIGFAADTENGLVVPVIRDADKKDVFELAGDLAALSARAREGKLKTDDIQGGVFTISSLGGIGGTFFTPIVNAPEVAILGVSKHQWRPVYMDGQFVPRLILPLSLSYDHRVIDGAAAVRFTTRLVETLGQVERLLEAVP